MFGDEQIMAILLEAEDVQMVHRQWPVNMRLAICLMASGDCQILLFRQEETSAFPTRLRKHLGLRADELSIYPEVPGFPTRAVKYSDERSLAALLVDAPNLLEDAQDYSVNYSYALDEGLDPVVFLGAAASEAKPELTTINEAIEDIDADAAAPVLTFETRRAKPEFASISLRKLNLDLSKEMVEEAGPAEPFSDASPISPSGQGFLSAQELAHFETPPGQYELVQSDGWFELKHDDSETSIIDDPAAIFLRDDHQLLAIRAPKGATELPKNVKFEASSLPAILRQTLAAACGEVHVSVEDGFLFVTLPEPKPVEVVQEESVETLKQPEPKSMWRELRRIKGMRLLALTSATTLAIFLILNSQPDGILNQNSENSTFDWNQFRLSMNSQSF